MYECNQQKCLNNLPFIQEDDNNQHTSYSKNWALHVLPQIYLKKATKIDQIKIQYPESNRWRRRWRMEVWTGPPPQLTGSRCARYITQKVLPQSLWRKPVTNFVISQRKLHTFRNICIYQTCDLKRQILKALKWNLPDWWLSSRRRSSKLLHLALRQPTFLRQPRSWRASREVKCLVRAG